MAGISWFEMDHLRVVLEYKEVMGAHGNFVLSIIDGCLAWEGEFEEIPAGIQAPPLRVRVVYPQGFPVAPIKVIPLSPGLPANFVGHTWHRWSDGSLCMGKPDQWDMGFTARDVMDKAADWYFNYQALVHGLIDKMPDVGRAQIPEGRASR